MAQAVLLSMDNDTTTAIQASVASTPPEALVLGGMATYYYSEYVESSSSMPSSPAPPPLARRPPAPATTPTIAALLEEMTCSINDFDILSQRLQDDRWSFLLSRICAYEFVSMLAHVNMDADQPRVAELLARYISSSCRFTCEYMHERRPIMRRTGTAPQQSNDFCRTVSTLKSTTIEFEKFSRNGIRPFYKVTLSRL
jgi:hypothetical protein